jgi:2-methylisocitrate lyase-like PEP mutase family enzyme
LFNIAQRICHSVDVPVSIDFETGYAATVDQLLKNVRELMDIGVVGINFEDQIIGSDDLRDCDEQCQRIAAIREFADQRDIPFFVNARTDLFLKAKAAGQDHQTLMDEAKKRATAYAQAGARGFFAPGLSDEILIRSLCEHSTLPVNIIRLPGTPEISTLASLGVGRVSYGPVAYRDLMAVFLKAAQSEHSQ